MDEETIEGRFELHEERLDHYGERIEKLEGKRDQNHGRRLEWIVIVLVALEAIFEVLMYVRGH